MSELTEVGKAFAGWAEENSGLSVDENFEYTDRTVGNFAAAAFAAGAEWQSQREPTEAEIEAAARVFFGNLHYPSASLDWDNAADSVKDNWRLKTRLALTATRKAVMA
jgi:formylglycine-generating enzyme required for sulfatase activity